MIYRQFDIAKIRFPFSDKNEAKPRPALIVSSTAYSTRHDEYICLMITTTNSHREDDIEIHDIELSGLHTKSKIRFKFAFIDVKLVDKKLGTIDIATQKKVQHNILACFI